MATPSPTGSRDPAPSGMDAVRLVRAVLPVVAAVAPPARGFLAALGQLPRLYTDPRYRPSPLGRIGPVAIAAAAVANYAFWNFLLPLPFVATWAERILLVGLGIGLYAILTRELDRYRAVLDYLTKYG